MRLSVSPSFRLGPFWLVRRPLDDHRAVFATTGIRVEESLAPANLWVDADPARLIQALSNVLANAEAGTTLTLNGSFSGTSGLTKAGAGTLRMGSGVLLNDVPGDGVPYVLTARHCENGSANGGAPGAAAR